MNARGFGLMLGVAMGLSLPVEAGVLPNAGGGLGGMPDGAMLVGAKKKAPAVKPAEQIDPAARAEFEAMLARAKAGDRSAMGTVASSYHWGNGVAKDEAASIAWELKGYEALVKLGEGGDTDAMAELAASFAVGSGAVPVDVAKALEWRDRRKSAFLSRAQAGDGVAMETLAGILEDSEFGDADYAAALGWWQKAAAAGRYPAMATLAEKYDEGIDVPADRATAMAWYLRAAQDPGDPWHARIMVAAKYKTGDGVAKNLAEAARLHVMIAEGYGGWRKRMRAESFVADVARAEPGYRKVVQQELVRRGLYDGRVDGQPSEALAAAIKKVWRSKVVE